MKKFLLLVTFLVVSIVSYGQDTFEVAFYNVLNYPLEDRPANRSQYLNTILADMAPDIFMACELNNEAGAQDILSILKNTVSNEFQMAPFVTNSSDDTFGDENELQNLVYYRSDLFILDDQTTITTSYRDFNHYRLKLNTNEQNSNPIFLNVIVAHLKSSSGTDNENLRKEMVDDLELFLETLDSSSYVLLAGDLNLYDDDEPAFIELLDQTNNIWFEDPANRIGNWHNNSSFIDVFTQSTRTQFGLGGATGGFDDRFDFILTSRSLGDGRDLSYVEDTYSVYGNNINPNCYNQEINSADCSGDDYSFEIRNALYNFSDHLPVTLQLQTNQTLSTPDFNPTASVDLIGTTIVRNVLRLKINSTDIFGPDLAVINSVGQNILSLKVENDVYVEQDVSRLANGVYYIIDKKRLANPIKFIVFN